LNKIAFKLRTFDTVPPPQLDPVIRSHEHKASSDRVATISCTRKISSRCLFLSTIPFARCMVL